jgi:hypothetical protein
MRSGPQHLPALALGNPPAAEPRCVSRLGAHVDGDTRNFETIRRIDRRDAAFAPVDLGDHGRREQRRADDGEKRDNPKLHGAPFGELRLEKEAGCGKGAQTALSSSASEEPVRAKARTVTLLTSLALGRAPR